MLQQINKEIEALQTNYIHPEGIERKLKEAKRLLEDIRYKKRSLEVSVQKENRDVENLEKTSIASLFYKCLGNYDKQLAKEKEEALAIQLKYEACEEQEKEMIKGISELTEQHYAMSQIQGKIDKLKEKKRDLIEQSGSKESQAIVKLREEIEIIRSEVKEIKEAISPANAAASTLHNAIDLLDSAGNWGTFDLLGGDFLADVMKHSKIDDAKECVLQAQNYIQRLQVELRDVNMNLDANIQITQAAVLADFFFDGLIADWYMQSKISESRDSVTKVYGEVSHILNKLSTQLEYKERELKNKIREIEMIIDEA